MLATADGPGTISGSAAPTITAAPTIFQGDLLFQKQIPLIVKQQQHHLPLSCGASVAGGTPSCPPTPLLFGNGGGPGQQHQQHNNFSNGTFSLQRRQLVTATVSFGFKNTSLSTGLSQVSPNRPKVLQITLTDEQDPYFLYQLEISEDEFVELKNEQNLLVDFAEFPWKFIELLEECIRASTTSSNASSSAAATPKFLAQMTNYSAGTPAARSLFTVVETNTFKHITHLSLQFLPGTDQSVKKYLASLVQSYKEQTTQLQSRLSVTDCSLRAELKSMADENARLKDSLDCLRFEASESESRLRLQHAEELAGERERLARERESVLRDLENGKGAMMSRYELQLSQLNSQLHESQTQQATISSKLRVTEDQLTAVRGRAEELQRDNELLRSESSRMREEKSESVGARQELEKSSNVLRKRCDDLESALKDKTAAVARLEDLCEQNRLLKSRLDQELDLFKSQSTELEQQLSVSVGEINKANEIIMKLQSDLKNSKSKLKLKSVVTVQQEKLIEEKQAFVEATQKELAEVKELLSRREQETDALRKNNESLKQQVEDGKKVISENNNVIEWLHKQINEEAIHKPFSTLGTVEYGGKQQRRYGANGGVSSTFTGSGGHPAGGPLGGAGSSRPLGSTNHLLPSSSAAALSSIQFSRSMPARPESPSNSQYPNHLGENTTITGHSTAAATAGYNTAPSAVNRHPLRTMAQPQFSSFATNINRKAVSSDSMSSLKLPNELPFQQTAVDGLPPVRSNYF